jgi:hypothetical protein
MNTLSTRPVVDYDEDKQVLALALHARAAVLVDAGLLPADYRRDCLTLRDARRAVESAEKEAAHDEALRVQAKRQRLIERGLSGMARLIISDDGTKTPAKPWNLDADKERNRGFVVSSPKHF